MDPDETARAHQAGAAQTRQAYPGPARTAEPARRAEEPMTRSEERLRVGTERDKVGVARLRKYVVTEQQQVDVPVSHEEVRVERHPVHGTGAGRGLGHPGIGEEQREIPLHADRPVVDTETVPVEEVRLGRDTVTDERRVGGPVRKERIEADLPDEGRRRLS
jgi:uncharacterized protein (TIGR02271 family)